jgi:hypothetical protein
MYARAKAQELEHSAGWGYERTNATSVSIRTGDCKIRGHRVVGNNTKTIMTFIGTEIALEYWNKDWEKYSAKHSKEEDVMQIDELLMRSGPLLHRLILLLVNLQLEVRTDQVDLLQLEQRAFFSGACARC